MEVKTVTIRNGAFHCDLYLTPELGTLPVTNWRKLLRLAMSDRDPWAAWYEENGKALREIRHYFPELLGEADRKAKQAETAWEIGRRPVTGNATEKARIKDYNDQLRRKASETRARYNKLLKLMTAFIEETQNYVL